MRRGDLLGKEFDWYAVDAAGHVAVMTTAGFGAVPDAVFEWLDGQELLARRLRERGLLLASEDPLLVAPLLAERGVFVYEWQQWHGPYRRVELPPHPLVLGTLALPATLCQQLVRFWTVDFAACAELRPEVLLPCSEPA